MRVRSTSLRKQHRRSGFTLIELLVVISIIATLAALILPGVQQARETARRTQCLNNMRNIGVAMTTYSTDHRGELPPLAGGETVFAASGTPWGPASWAVHLLPYLEQRGLFDRLLDPSVRAASETLNSLASTNIEVYTCPDDPSDGANGAMTYVVNGGYATSDVWSANGVGHSVQTYDWDESGVAGDTPYDVNVESATGVFFQERFQVPTASGTDTILTAPAGFKNTLDKVTAGDGLSQTIFLTENLDTLDWNSSATGSSFPSAGGGWSSAATGNGGFVGYRKGDNAFCIMMDGSAPDPGNYGPLGAGPDPNQLAFTSAGPFPTAALQACKINKGIGVATPGNAPRPSSLHPSLVNVIFGDGHGRNIADNIDDSVFIRLVSSNGNRFGQAILSNDDY